MQYILNLEVVHLEQIDSLKQQLLQLKEIYSAECGAKKILEKNLIEKEKEVSILRSEIDKHEQAKLLIKRICQEARRESGEFFCHLTTSALQNVFGDNVELTLELNEQRDNPTLDFVVKTRFEDYEVENDPAESDGGGVADIISLVCFLTLNYLKRDENKASLTLDEPTKFLSAGNSESAGEFLKEMSRHLNRQIIMVTHHECLKDIADQVYELSINEKGYTAIVSNYRNDEQSDNEEKGDEI